MKNIVKITAVAGLVVSLSGCAQIDKAANGLWGGTKSVAKFVSAPVTKLLRGSPDQDYVFVEEVLDGENYEVQMYEAPQTLDYTMQDYEIEMFDAPALRSAPTQTYAMSNPREVSFVRLNGDSEAADWRNCEMVNRGYLLASETEFRVNPDFEVCMRNKGYVMETEVSHYGTYGGQGVTAPRSTAYTSGYSFP